MALPLTSDFVINVLRETCASIEQKESEDSFQNADYSIVGGLYRPEHVETTVNLKQEFPLLAQLEQERAIPIKYVTNDDPLDEEDADRDNWSSTTSSRSRRLSASTSRRSMTADRRASMDAPLPQPLETPLETPLESSTPAKEEHEDVKRKKSRFAFTRLMRRKSASAEGTLEPTTKASRTDPVDDSSSSDESLIDPQDSVAPSDPLGPDENSEPVAGSLDVSSIESSDIADDDDLANQSPQYLTGDPSQGSEIDADGTYYSDDYFDDSEEYLSDSDYMDESSMSTSTLAKGTHPVSKVNFTHSRPGTYQSMRLHRNMSMTRVRGTSFSRGAVPPKSYQEMRALKRSSQSLTDMLGLYREGDTAGEQLDFTKRWLPKIEVKRKTSDGSLDSLPDEPEIKVAKRSNLTSLINRKSLSLDYYEYVGKKKAETDRIRPMTIMIPGLGRDVNNPLQLKVNETVTVVEMIGYALLTLQQANALDGQHSQPNYWAVYLADDDGEAEDDFGVLARTREVKSYNTDEFVMVEVSDDQMRANESLTPSPLEQAQQPGRVDEIKRQQRQRSGRTSSLATILSGVGETSSKHSRSLQKRSSSAKTAISLEDDDNASMITSGSIEKDEYKPQKSLLMQQASKEDQAADPEADSAEYHRFKVWRRQQMSFRGRHSRTMAIDGYQIYILPFNDTKGTWYDAKTTSFNISQVRRVKQSSKVPRYFKVVVDKHNDGVLKKYYLEAENEKECKVIVKCIQGLLNSYRKSHGH